MGPTLINASGPDASGVSLTDDGNYVVYQGDKAIDKYNLSTQTESAVAAGFDADVSGNGTAVNFVGVGNVIYQDANGTTGNTFSTFVSADANGNPTQYPTESHAYASDSGKYVAFVSGGTDLVPFVNAANNPNDIAQMYLKNTDGPISVVSVNASGQFANAQVNQNDGSISSDGTAVGFDTKASNLDPRYVVGVNGNEAYVARNGTLTTLSSANGVLADGNSSSVSLDHDGSVAAFQSSADNLGYSSGGNDEIYVKNLTSANTSDSLVLASATSTGVAAGGGDSQTPSLSADGKYVAFASSAKTLGGNGTTDQIYVKNLVTGTLTLVSQNQGQAGNASSGIDEGNQRFSADDTKLLFTTSATNLVQNGNGVVLASQGAPPTVAVDPINGNAPVNRTEAANSFTISGSATAGDNITVHLDGQGSAALSPVQADATGKWSVSVSPAALAGLGQRTHSLFVTAQGDPNTSYLSASATQTYTIDTVAPSVAITSAGATTTNPKQTVSGTGEANTNVALFDNGGSTPVGGPVMVDGNGNWSTQVTLPNQGQNSIVATDTDNAGNTGASSPVTYTYAPLSVAFDATTSGFVNGRTPVITGKVTGASGPASVEILNGGQDLGAATVNGNGTWSFSSNIGQGDFNALTAVATDASGASAKASAPYELVTGIGGEPYRAQEYDYGSDGSYGYTDYARNGTPLVEASDNGNGTHTIAAYANGQALQSIGNDTMTGNGVGERFVFVPNFGHDEVTDFIAGGAFHDTIDLSNTGLGGLAAALRHTTMSGAGAVVHVDPQDAITLDGVTKAQLKAHPHDFAFA